MTLRKRGNFRKWGVFDWWKVMSYESKAKNTRINANLEIHLLGGLRNFWRYSLVFAMITL